MLLFSVVVSVSPPPMDVIWASSRDYVVLPSTLDFRFEKESISFALLIAVSRASGLGTPGEFPSMGASFLAL